MDPKATDRPQHVICTFEGRESFHSGHMTVDAAEVRAAKATNDANRLGVDAAYCVVAKSAG